jgi:hypothetical protein
MIEIHKDFEVIDGPTVLIYGIIKANNLHSYSGRPTKLKEDIYNVIENMVGPIDDSYKDLVVEVHNREYSLTTQIKPIVSNLNEGDIEKNLNELGDSDPITKTNVENALKAMERSGGNRLMSRKVIGKTLYYFDYKLLEGQFNPKSIEDYLVYTKAFLCTLGMNDRSNINSHIDRENGSMTVSLEVQRPPPLYV